MSNRRLFAPNCFNYTEEANEIARKVSSALDEIFSQYPEVDPHDMIYVVNSEAVNTAHKATIGRRLREKKAKEE